MEMISLADHTAGLLHERDGVLIAGTMRCVLRSRRHS